MILVIKINVWWNLNLNQGGNLLIWKGYSYCTIQFGGEKKITFCLLIYIVKDMLFEKEVRIAAIFHFISPNDQLLTQIVFIWYDRKLQTFRKKCLEVRLRKGKWCTRPFPASSQNKCVMKLVNWWAEFRKCSLKITAKSKRNVRKQKKKNKKSPRRSEIR